MLSNPHGGPVSSSNDSGATEFDSCGANFCVMNTNSNENLARPADAEIYEISGIYLACILLAVFLIAVLVDPLSR